MMNIIDFFKEFEFIKRRRLRSLGGAKICSGGCEYMLRGVRPDRGAPLKPPMISTDILIVFLKIFISIPLMSKSIDEIQYFVFQGGFKRGIA